MESAKVKQFLYGFGTVRRPALYVAARLAACAIIVLMMLVLNSLGTSTSIKVAAGLWLVWGSSAVHRRAFQNIRVESVSPGDIRIRGSFSARTISSGQGVPLVDVRVSDQTLVLSITEDGQAGTLSTKAGAFKPATIELLATAIRQLLEGKAIDTAAFKASAGTQVFEKGNNQTLVVREAPSLMLLSLSTTFALLATLGAWFVWFR